MSHATISPTGELSISKPIRDQLNLQPGTVVTFAMEGDSLLITPSTVDPPDWRSMQGMVRTLFAALRKSPLVNLPKFFAPA